MPWFSVRCIFALTYGEGVYEERVTLWRASSSDEALRLAEAEAADYADGLGRYIGLAQSFEMLGDPEHGAEIYSLIRTSDLDDDDYLTAFFDTGTERTRR
jgi:hypothetical protein